MGEGLTLKAQYATMAERFASHDTGIVDEELNWEIVCAIDDEVILLDDVECVVSHQQVLYGIHLHIRIDGKHLLLSREHLGNAHILSEMNYLALEVAQVNHIAVYDTYLAHASSCEVERNRSTQTACSHYEHLGILDFLLTLYTHILQENVTGIAVYFFFGKVKHIKQIFYLYGNGNGNENENETWLRHYDTHLRCYDNCEL